MEVSKRRRQAAGQTPSDAMEAQRRKRNELIGEMVAGGKREAVVTPAETPLLPITDAVRMFLQHVRVHSPDKPRTARRYTAVLDHLERILGHKMFIESISRPDIDDYKTTRSAECREQHKDRPITPRTNNYEVAVFRTLFYFLIRERNPPIGNPCANQATERPTSQVQTPSTGLPAGRTRPDLCQV